MGEIWGRSILEFGNQCIWEHAKIPLGTTRDVARNWFLDLGVKEYISLDVNKRDGALPIDLTQEIPNEFIHLVNHFDFVTNIGTSEHCGDTPVVQWMLFQNAAILCKIGGMVLHQLVPAGQWKDHCIVWYKDGIGSVLSQFQKMRLIVEERINLKTLNPEVDYLCVALRKIKNTPLNIVPPFAFIDSLVIE